MPWKGNTSNPVPNSVQEPIDRAEKATEINRAEQLRRDTDTQKNFTIKLNDVDDTILQQLENLQLQVTNAGKEIKVPIYYGSPERWVSAQRDGYLRDKQGKIILPVIVFKRTTTASDDTLRMFNRNLVVPARQMYSEKNQYTKFNVLVGQNAPVAEVYNTVVPTHVLLTYHFIVWTAYVAQMNTLTEALKFATSNIPYWGSSRGFRFRAKVESFGHTVEFESGQERVIKTEFDMEVHAYLLPDMMTELERHKSTTQKKLTPKKIVMGVEAVQTGFNPSSDGNLEKWRNPNYPNLQYNVEIPTPGISSDTTIQDHSFLPGGVWAGIPVDNSPLFLRVVPVPTQQNEGGQDGDMSYDSQYFYFHTDHQWKRVSIGEFTPTCSDNISLTGNEGVIEYNPEFFYIYSNGQWRKTALATTDLTTTGQSGDIMYDNIFLYIYIDGSWRKIAVAEF
jgi:hypothetical protein